jgi:hypothetical protein
MGWRAGKLTNCNQLNGRMLVVVFNSGVSEDGNFTARFRIWKFQTAPWAQYSIFRCVFWLNSSFFSSDDRDILQEEVKTYLMARRTQRYVFICTSVVYGRGYSALNALEACSFWASSSRLNFKGTVLLPLIVFQIFLWPTGTTSMTGLGRGWPRYR